MSRGNSQSRGLVPITQPGKSLWCRQPNNPWRLPALPCRQIVLRACGMAAKATARPSIEYRARDMPHHGARRGSRRKRGVRKRAFLQVTSLASSFPGQSTSTFPPPTMPPNRNIEFRQSSLVHSRNVWRRSKTSFGSDGICVDAPITDMRQRVRRLVEHQVDIATHQILHCWSSTAILDKLKGRTAEPLEVHPTDV